MMMSAISQVGTGHTSFFFDHCYCLRRLLPHPRRVLASGPASPRMPFATIRTGSVAGTRGWWPISRRPGSAADDRAAALQEHDVAPAAVQLAEALADTDHPEAGAA